MIIPRKTGALSVESVTQSAIITPTSANGTDMRMMSGSTSDSLHRQHDEHEEDRQRHHERHLPVRLGDGLFSPQRPAVVVRNLQAVEAHGAIRHRRNRILLGQHVAIELEHRFWFSRLIEVGPSVDGCGPRRAA
jgi:hypothetical protein